MRGSKFCRWHHRDLSTPRRNEVSSLSINARKALRWMGESTEAGKMTDEVRWETVLERWGLGVFAELRALNETSP
jgi:hypothetical protein